MKPTHTHKIAKCTLKCILSTIKKKVLSTAQVLIHTDFEIFVNEDCLVIQYLKNSSNPIKLMSSVFIRNRNEKTVSFLAGENQDPFTEAFYTNKRVLKCFICPFGMISIYNQQHKSTPQ